MILGIANIKKPTHHVSVQGRNIRLMQSDELRQHFMFLQPVICEASAVGVQKEDNW